MLVRNRSRIRLAKLSKLLYPQDLLEYSLYSSLKDGKGGETRVLAAAKGAAFLVQKSLSTVFCPGHEEVLDERPNVFEGVKQDLFLALTKLALTICDMVIARQNFAKQAQCTVALLILNRIPMIYLFHPIR